MKIPGALLSTTALLWGFYQAPFSHIHPEDFDHPTSSALVHWHLQVLPAVGSPPSLNTPAEDDDAIDLSWNALRTPIAQVPFNLEFAETVHPPVEPVGSSAIAVPRPRGHDPPELSHTSPRAPPF